MHNGGLIHFILVHEQEMSSVYSGLDALFRFETRIREFDKFVQFHSCSGISGREVARPFCKALASNRHIKQRRPFSAGLTINNLRVHRIFD